MTVQPPARPTPDPATPNKDLESAANAAREVSIPSAARCQRHTDRRGWPVTGSLVWTRLCDECADEFGTDWTQAALAARPEWSAREALDVLYSADAGSDEALAAYARLEEALSPALFAGQRDPGSGLAPAETVAK